MIPKLRIAAELYAAPGWVPIVPDSDSATAYRKDVVLWVAPQTGSHEIARLIVEALNQRPADTSQHRPQGE